MSDTSLIVVAEVHGLAGSHGRLDALLTELAGHASAEAGCNGFRVLPSDVVVHQVSSTVHAPDPEPPDPGMLG